MTGTEAELADVVARLRRAMRRAARGADPGNPLSVAQLELLSSLADNPGAQPGQLARALRLAPNSVTTLVNGLRARDLVTRASGVGDRRTVRLTLTEAGEDMVRHWQATNAEILRTALAGLHPGWQHVLSAALPALRELIGAIDEFAEEANRAVTDPRPGRTAPR
ncbi:MarR family winged helix-turn-helix transcriptional regulator [Amycolatopsis alkalitolerans]|uniref:MarR family transcriptional regulator n=1 Tax=Amycolatopsis alkalitolerans TaxID=2547244 RepID=A0A5C4MCA1_9PSEU|nr:MarR family transcriptional regulator [Amycolatopsis alkalitolerans]TNC29651.1 MarR family transcriptional regulator [Amycolatopsis alkalitolerans]